MFAAYLPVEEYLRKLSGQEKEIPAIDHNYVKAWSNHPDSQRTKPARLLFMKGFKRYPLLSNTSNLSDEIDIETCEETQLSPFDSQKMKLLASECERSLRCSLLFKENNEDEIDMSEFAPRQRKLYEQVMNILNADQLAKLSYAGSPNEPLKKRIATDKTAREIRQKFGLIFWDMELLGWLHKILLTTSDISILSTYVDVLQTLKSKVPELVDRILQSCVGSAVGDAVIVIMKKPWDPVMPILNQNKPRKLPGSPIILICPSTINQQVVFAHSHRLRFWHNNLSSMCKVMNVPANSEEGRSPTSIEECLNQIITSVRNKVIELKNHYPNRPLILLGWTIGALIASHIALQEPVSAVICLGFPLTGVNGSRGDLNDPLLDCTVPTLFIVGQNSRTCTTDDIEDFRSRMKAETGLVVVGGADDMLRIGPTKMKLCCVTQAIVDRCLVDEVGEFLSSVFVKLPSTSAAGNTLVPSKVCTPIKEEDPEAADEDWKPEDDGKRKRRKPREYSPELSPVRKRQKHMSRQVAPIPKSRLSPSSSETSSAGSIHEKESKSAKKISERKVGRPATGTWRKRLKIKPIKDPRKETKLLRKAARLADESYLPSKRTDTKSTLPFSKNILPKRNEPVDVTAAFGCDNTFLPCPLTLPEPEDTVSAEETEKVMAELEAQAQASVAQQSQTTTPPSNTISLLGKETSFLPISAKLADSPLTEFTTIMSPIAKSTANAEESKQTPATSVVINSTLKNALHKAIQNVASTVNSKNVSHATTLQNASLLHALTNASSLKNVSSTPTIKTSLQNVISKGAPFVSTLKPLGLTTTTSSNPSSKSTLTTVPSPIAASILASSPRLKGQTNKVIHVISKGSPFLTTKPTTATLVAAGNETSDRQQSNLSLLSDVAGMTEPMSEMAKKAATTPNATLVKLAATERMTHFQPMKVVKTMPPIRAETTEEMVEKQLAIQALNKSIGLDSLSTPSTKESGYSVCYAKPDGSIITHSVTRPTVPAYLSRPNMPSPSPTRRGRGRPPYSNRPFRFYPH